MRWNGGLDRVKVTWSTTRMPSCGMLQIGERWSLLATDDPERTLRTLADPPALQLQPLADRGAQNGAGLVRVQSPASDDGEWRRACGHRKKKQVSRRHLWPANKGRVCDVRRPVSSHQAATLSSTTCVAWYKLRPCKSMPVDVVLQGGSGVSGLVSRRQTILDNARHTSMTSRSDPWRPPDRALWKPRCACGPAMRREGVSSKLGCNSRGDGRTCSA
jgi:hypothetical protein